MWYWYADLYADRSHAGKAFSVPASVRSRLVVYSSAGVILSGERSSGYACIVHQCSLNSGILQKITVEI